MQQDIWAGLYLLAGSRPHEALKGPAGAAAHSRPSVAAGRALPSGICLHQGCLQASERHNSFIGMTDLAAGSAAGPGHEDGAAAANSHPVAADLPPIGRHPLACAAALHMLGPLLLLKARESTSIAHVVVFSLAATDHHGYLYLQVVLRRQGQGWARVGRQDRSAQRGARKHVASSQQEGAAQVRPHKRVWGSQQVLLSVAVGCTCMI